MSKTTLWTGRILSLLPALLLLFSASMKFAQPKEAMEGFAHLGWPIHLAIPLGIVESACTILYLVPRTSVLGAVLLTGYLGGAVAAHVRLDERDFFTPAAVGVVVWLGLYLRDPRLRALLPLRSSPRP